VEAISETLLKMSRGDVKTIARSITIVENELDGFKELLFSLYDTRRTPVIGFTGPPGAGKSTLINALIREYSGAGKKVAVIAIDPTSPFNYGTLLGDRLRMSEHFNDPNVFIRSIATRGSLGGLTEKTIEIVDVLKAANFDVLIIETVGVGQTEVEIAGLADTTVVILVPEAGDEVQMMKSGIMEIADIFVVNKSDRDGAGAFLNNLQKLVHSFPEKGWITPVLATAAITRTGIQEVIEQIEAHGHSASFNKKKSFVLLEKAYRLIQKKRMQDINKVKLHDEIEKAILASEFNIYRFADCY
jgi:LAO/AO transport system kinase